MLRQNCDLPVPILISREQMARKHTWISCQHLNRLQRLILNPSEGPKNFRRSSNAYGRKIFKLEKNKHQYFSNHKSHTDQINLSRRSTLKKLFLTIYKKFSGLFGMLHTAKQAQMSKPDTAKERRPKDGVSVHTACAKARFSH